MRRLLYVPIIHAQSDLGSLGLAIDQASASMIGGSRWSRHKMTVDGYWNLIDRYLASIDAIHLKIYQDGLAAEGELGRKVVEEASRRGSKNHQIVLSLMNRGAEIRLTEDLALLLEEARRLLQATQGGAKTRDLQQHEAHEQGKPDLTAQRDRFIAERINSTLAEGETGLLLIGAYHNVLPLLAGAIEVTQVKQIDKVRTYFQELLSGNDENRLQELASYLVSPHGR